MMSAAASEICTQAESRLVELRPYLEEAARLWHVIETLRGSEDADEAELAALLERVRPPAPDPQTKRQPKQRRAPHGSNKRLILAALLDAPGSTASEIAATTGLKRGTVASTICRLKRSGELERSGVGARVPAKRVAETRALLAG
jgi:MarR family